MKEFAKKALMIIVGIAAYFAVKIAVQQFWNNPPDKEEIAVNVQSDYEQQVQDARAKYPELTTTEAVTLEMQGLARERLNSAKSGSEKKNKAASMFFGFYWVNTRSRKVYCNKQWIDITNFTNDFANAHKSEHARAKEILRNADFESEQLWSLVEDLNYKQAAQDMRDIQRTYDLTPIETCQMFAESADEIVPEMLLSKRSPEIHNALLSSQ